MENQEIKDLKSKAYDIISNIEFLRGELQKVNTQIQEKFKELKDADDKLRG